MSACLGRNNREGKAFVSKDSFETCSGGGAGTRLPPEVMLGDGDDRLRRVAPFVLRGLMELPGGRDPIRFAPLDEHLPDHATLMKAAAGYIGIHALKLPRN